MLSINGLLACRSEHFLTQWPVRPVSLLVASCRCKQFRCISTKTLTTDSDSWRPWLFTAPWSGSWDCTTRVHLLFAPRNSAVIPSSWSFWSSSIFNSSNSRLRFNKCKGHPGKNLSPSVARISGDNAETSTLASLHIDRRKGYRFIFVGS